MFQPTIRRSSMEPDPIPPIRPIITIPRDTRPARPFSPSAWVWPRALPGVMPGEIATGEAAMSISTLIETPISITTLTGASIRTGSRTAKGAGASGSTTRKAVRVYPTGTRPPLRGSTGGRPEMQSPGRPSVDAPRQEGRILLVEARTILRAAQGADGRTRRLAGTRVPGADVRTRRLAGTRVPRADGRTRRLAGTRVHRADGRMRLLAGTRAPEAAVGLSREKAAVDLSVPGAGERTAAPSVVMVKGARRDSPATGGAGACHRPDPAVVEAAEVEVAADADKDRG